MSHVICLLARAGGFATRWGGNWLVEAAVNGRRMATGSPVHEIDGLFHGRRTSEPSNVGQSHGTAASLPSNDGRLHRTVTSGASIDGQSHRTRTSGPSIDGRLHRAWASAPLICRILESLGAVLAPKRPFWHLFTLNRPPIHACPPI